MSTLTIELSDELVARLTAASERAQVPPAQIVQAALDKALPVESMEHTAAESSLYDLMKDGFGCVESGFPDLATNPKYMEALPASAGNSSATSVAKPSALELLQDLVGCFDSGVTDLATNPKHMEGFGEWRR